MSDLFHSATGLWGSAGTAALGLLFTAWLARGVLSADAGTEKMRRISGLIQKGAMAFLRRQYLTIAWFALALAVVMFFGVAKKTALAFLLGAACSTAAGYIGMRIATSSNARTAQAASRSYTEAISVAFPGGAVMGLAVVCLGLLGLSAAYLLFTAHALGHKPDLTSALLEATPLIAGFSMGASSVALFARVGGGIYTKAADVGADLVGKVEAGIPEDDPRNPAVIADNVGDNVGDVAGMGADLYESYVGALVSAIVIAAAPNPVVDTPGILLTFLLAAWGIVCSILSVFFARTKEGADPASALRNAMIASAVLFLAGAAWLCLGWYKPPSGGGSSPAGAFGAVSAGLVAGMLVGLVAEKYTSGRPVQKIAEAAQTGPATTLISGMAVAMRSTWVPLVGIAVATLASYAMCGIFGVALSAVGMLALTGTTVAVDAYGPIADNAAGIAQMAGMGPEVRKRAEKLDAVGNTTAAVGKGFAIGSAALTALALFTAFAETAGLSSLNALSASVVAGLFLGAGVPFVFSAATMSAVGQAAFGVVQEVRRQWREIAGLREGNADPDSAACVDITTRAALKEMIFPGALAVVAPLLTGLLLGVEALGGFLIGSLITGVPLAIYMANAGGAWDNAKKYVEEGHLGGKGSEVHRATVIGDTVGDPLKDTAGPSLNILLKLMAVVSLIFVPWLARLHHSFFALFR